MWLWNFRGSCKGTWNKPSFFSKFQGNTDAYCKGVEDGKIFSISDKITEGNSDEAILLENKI